MSPAAFAVPLDRTTGCTGRSPSHPSSKHGAMQSSLALRPDGTAKSRREAAIIHAGHLRQTFVLVVVPVGLPDMRQRQTDFERYGRGSRRRHRRCACRSRIRTFAVRNQVMDVRCQVAGGRIVVDLLLDRRTSYSCGCAQRGRRGRLGAGDQQNRDRDKKLSQQQLCHVRSAPRYFMVRIGTTAKSVSSPVYSRRNSTRRFRERPSGVSLVACGDVSP